MIRAVIFDLDGTLIQTEAIKALSYARAAVELSDNGVTEVDVIDAFKDVVGRSRQEVAETLMRRFDLENAATERLQEFDVKRPWQAFVQVRLSIYDELLADADLLEKHKCPYNVGFLQHARQENYCTGLATMSYCAQVQKMLRLLNLQGDFDFIATRDDVENGKPDPEIYNLVAKELQVGPDECLVIEDSTSGAEAAMRAKMHCIVVTTDFTRKAIHESGLIDEQLIVDDPRELKSVAQKILSREN